MNRSEKRFSDAAHAKDILVIHIGLPDFVAIDTLKWLWGFVEHKGDGDRLRDSQRIAHGYLRQATGHDVLISTEETTRALMFDKDYRLDLPMRMQTVTCNTIPELQERIRRLTAELTACQQELAVHMELANKERVR